MATVGGTKVQSIKKSSDIKIFADSCLLFGMLAPSTLHQ
jgi:hypothetical protein